MFYQKSLILSFRIKQQFSLAESTSRAGRHFVMSLLCTLRKGTNFDVAYMLIMRDKYTINSKRIICLLVTWQWIENLLKFMPYITGCVVNFNVNSKQPPYSFHFLIEEYVTNILYNIYLVIDLDSSG